MRDYIREAYGKKYSNASYDFSNLYHTYRDVTDAALEAAILDSKKQSAEALAYFKSLIRESFDKADIQQRQEIIETVQSFGMDELEGFVDQLLKDLKADYK